MSVLLAAIFFAVAAAFIGVAMFVSFSRRGRTTMLKIAGVKVSRTLREFGETNFMGHRQVLRLLECEGKEGPLLVLEAELTQATRTARSVTWLKLEPEDAKQLLEQ